jgi:hypothetical protein
MAAFNLDNLAADLPGIDAYMGPIIIEPIIFPLLALDQQIPAPLVFAPHSTDHFASTTRRSTLVQSSPYRLSVFLSFFFLTFKSSPS